MATAGLGTTRHVAEAARADRHESGRSAAGSWRTARQKGRRSNRQFKFVFLRFVFFKNLKVLVRLLAAQSQRNVSDHIKHGQI